jgi:hypothetical protein
MTVPSGSRGRVSHLRATLVTGLALLALGVMTALGGCAAAPSNSPAADAYQTKKVERAINRHENRILQNRSEYRSPANAEEAI